MRRQWTIRLAILAVSGCGFSLWAQDVAPSGHEAPASGSLPPHYSCPFCDMRGADLSGQTLTDVNLEGANLEGANLSSTILGGTVLAGANLQRASLDKARMTRSEKGRTDLSHANVTGASINGTQFGDADLQYIVGLARDTASLEKALLGPRPGIRKNVKSGRGIKAVAGVSCGKADLSKLQSAIYVTLAGTDSDTCGATKEQACKTIAKGLLRCAPAGCGVLVGYGEYQLADPIAVRDGVNVYGGCVPSSEGDADFQSLVDAPAGGRPAVVANSIKTGVILQGFKLAGTPAAASPSAASVVVSVSGTSNLTLLDTRILAGSGTAGSRGSEGTRGGQGGAANGASGGTNTGCATNGGNGSVIRGVTCKCYFASFFCAPTCSANDCRGYPGAPGSTSRSAPGGGWGDWNKYECAYKRGETGHGGEPGAAAACGNKGVVSSSTAGVFSNGTWTQVPGGNGTRGGDGGGGGGGGAGGPTCGCCVWSPIQRPGNQGGGGGAGGCGGGLGGGGQQGGASFGIVLIGSTVTFANSAVIGGRGGDGGDGGAAAQGGGAGVGAGGLGYWGGGYGGGGGSGGDGGSGGGGAGGNGGPAVGAALVGSSRLDGTGTVYYPGASGAFGSAGEGGQPVKPQACAGPDGDYGVPGVVADTHVY
jgi:uncharacterized protein YjbI with pentapeptide repeats